MSLRECTTALKKHFFYCSLSAVIVFSLSSFVFHLARMHGEGACYHGSSYLFSDKNKSNKTPLHCHHSKIYFLI